MSSVAAIDFSELLKDIPRGAWVALASDKSHVVAYGSDMHKVLSDAHDAGEGDPILMRVPECASALVL